MRIDRSSLRRRVVAVLLTLAMLFTAGWTHPPIVGTQIGYRGTGDGPDHDARRRRSD